MSTSSFSWLENLEIDFDWQLYMDYEMLCEWKVKSR